MWCFHLSNMLQEVCFGGWFGRFKLLVISSSFRLLISRVRTRAPGLSVIHWIRSGWLQSHIVCLPKPSVPLVSSCCSFRPSSSGPVISIYAQCVGNTLGQNQGLAEPKLHAYCRISAVGDNLKSCYLAFPSCYDHIEVHSSPNPIFLQGFSCILTWIDGVKLTVGAVDLVLVFDFYWRSDLTSNSRKGQKAIVQFQAFQESDCTIYFVCTGLFFSFFSEWILGASESRSHCVKVCFSGSSRAVMWGFHSYRKIWLSLVHI